SICHVASSPSVQLASTAFSAYPRASVGPRRSHSRFLANRLHRRSLKAFKQPTKVSCTGARPHRAALRVSIRIAVYLNLSQNQYSVLIERDLGLAGPAAPSGLFFYTHCQGL